MSVTKAPPPSPVAIVGSRDFKDLDKVRAFVRSLPPSACVISGGARGVDQAAEAKAIECGLFVASYRPVFIEGSGYKVQLVEMQRQDGRCVTTFPKWYFGFPAAAHARNSMIVRRCVEEAGAVVAFWTGKKENSGTYSVIQKATQAGVLYDVIRDSVTV